MYTSWLSIGIESILSHPLDKIAAISHTMFSEAFSWMNIFLFD